MVSLFKSQVNHFHNVWWKARPGQTNYLRCNSSVPFFQSNQKSSFGVHLLPLVLSSVTECGDDLLIPFIFWTFRSWHLQVQARFFFSREEVKRPKTCLILSNGNMQFEGIKVPPPTSWYSYSGILKRILKLNINSSHPNSASLTWIYNIIQPTQSHISNIDLPPICILPS